mmetsp:Transcript_19205/g.30505  ORF Transcript_19205/g.30505 Transcript_19205/m.30505 type:complete len:209 (+) Transcript_19205:517-1143(+)
MGFSSGMIISCSPGPNFRSASFSRFAASVSPVHVIQSPSISPFCSRYFRTAGVPPILCISSMTYLPLGLRSAINGTFWLILLKASSSSSTPAARAIAKRWSTAFVDPPRAIVSTIEFSNAALDIISLGFRSSSRRFLIAFPAFIHSSCFILESAGYELECGNAIPIASIAQAMVLAVYIPPHAPGPGHEFRTISFRSSSLTSPAINCP